LQINKKALSGAYMSSLVFTAALKGSIPIRRMPFNRVPNISGLHRQGHLQGRVLPGNTAASKLPEVLVGVRKGNRSADRHLLRKDCRELK